MHAELKIGDSIIMLSDEWPEYGALSPLSSGGAGMGLHIYVDGVDAAFDRAVKAGAEVEMPVMDQFWGDRYGKLKDPFGHKWSIATHTKDLSMDEMKHGMDEAMEKAQRKCKRPRNYEPVRSSESHQCSCGDGRLQPVARGQSPAAFTPTLISQQNSQIPQIISRRSRSRSHHPAP